MLAALSEDQKKALVESLNNFLMGLPVGPRMKALETLDQKLWSHLYNEKVSLTEAHKGAFRGLIEHWLAGNDPYSYFFNTEAEMLTGEERKNDPYGGVSADLVELTEADRIELKALFEDTEIEDFQFTHDHGFGHWTTQCVLRIRNWRGQVDYQFHPTSDDGFSSNHFSFYSEAKNSKSLRQISLSRPRRLLSTSLSHNLAFFYFALASFDLLHRMQQPRGEFAARPLLLEYFQGVSVE